MTSFIERHKDRIHGVLSCWDRVIIQGTLPGFCYAEGMTSYKPWHDKTTQKTFLKPDSGKCLHHYCYFVDPILGLCYLRVLTWCPFRLQFYFNGHNRLATKLAKAAIPYQLTDNAFTQISDFSAAQRLADDFKVDILHKRLDCYARLYCPVIQEIKASYHFSLMQVEYATDILFKSQETLKPLYDALIRTAVHAVKVDKIATVLGKKRVGQFQGEIGHSLTPNFL